MADMEKVAVLFLTTFMSVSLVNADLHEAAGISRYGNS